MGRTRPAAVFNLIGYYAVGLPLGWWLAFERGHGLGGLWWGLAVGLAAVGIPLLVWIAKFGPARMHATLVDDSPRGAV
jgi:MATE family multidrug resistance protein